MKPDEFEKIIETLRPVWTRKITSVYKRPGRNFKLPLEDMTLLLLLYYRSYITQEFIGYLFGLDNSNVSRLIKKVETCLSEVMFIKKAKKLSKNEVEALIIDATEQDIKKTQQKTAPILFWEEKTSHNQNRGKNNAR